MKKPDFSGFLLVENRGLEPHEIYAICECVRIDFSHIYGVFCFTWNMQPSPRNVIIAHYYAFMLHF